jgi:hypothetical protein
LKNQWNSVMVNPDFHTRLPSPLFEQHVAGGAQRGNERPSADPYLPGSSVDPAPASPVKQPPAPKWGAGPGTTPPVVIDMTDEKKRPSSDYHWDVNEKKAVDAYLKTNCGLEGTEPASRMCFHDMWDILYPSFFRAIA